MVSMTWTHITRGEVHYVQLQPGGLLIIKLPIVLEMRLWRRCIQHMEWEAHSICSNHMSFLKLQLKLKHSSLTRNQLWNSIANASYSGMHLGFLK
jgi:hypothetical protein